MWGTIWVLTQGQIGGSRREADFLSVHFVFERAGFLLSEARGPVFLSEFFDRWFS